MSTVLTIFETIHKLIREDSQRDFGSILINNATKTGETDGSNQTSFQLWKDFLQKIINEIDNLAAEIKTDNSILISVKHQKLLRTCFELVTSVGISTCLIPGLGISLSKRCLSAAVLPPSSLTDKQKYEVVTACTDFFTRSYEVPVLKNIIITFYLSDFLAALIQLSFAPLKKPGTYKNFNMTKEMYDQLNLNRQKYNQVYEHLVTNCFQPTLMKELLVLHSVTDPLPPVFVRKVIAKEMSRRLLVSGGLLSLIRCFIESYDTDTGYEWKKINMICKIVTAKHGNDTQDIYLNNICAQLITILSSNNVHYLATAVSCVLCLHEKYPQSDSVKVLVKEVLQAFDYNFLTEKSTFPGTIILAPQEVEQKVNILHACVCRSKLDWSVELFSPNLYVLFLLGVKCTLDEEMKIKLKDSILKCLEPLNKNELASMIKLFLFGKNNVKVPNILIDEFEAGLAIKCATSHVEHQGNEAIMYILTLFNASTDDKFIGNVFEALLQILIDLSGKRQQRANKEMLILEEDEVLLDNIDEQYGGILQLLSEISTSPRVTSALKTNASIVLPFIEHFILETQIDSNEDCVTISLVLLNTILSNSNNSSDLSNRCSNLIPVLKKMAKNDSNFNNILCKEAISLILLEQPSLPQKDTLCGKAISDTFDNLLPVRAHGIIELTKLVEFRDPETISKKHYIFCLFQEQLKDPDSYIYLSAINGIASLSTYCTEDVLQVLCKEFLQEPTVGLSFETKEDQNRNSELRMKIGDVIVKVTKRLGEMAVVHKTLLLNTMLCGCRDYDSLIRTSALSNLAEISLVLHYKIGTIIYEVLMCIWSIIETDKAIECRRAAVMVISSLLKGLGKETLVQLKENLLPIYRTLKKLYREPNEDSVVRLHAQIALEELNDAVNQFLSPVLTIEK